MDLAFLCALALCVALFVYALRTAADRDRWKEEAETKRTGFEVRFAKRRK